MTNDEKVWTEFLHTATLIFAKIQANDLTPLSPEHVKQDLSEFKELNDHIEKAKNIVDNMVSEDNKALDKGNA